MKTITVRLPEGLAAQLEAEARARNVSKSDVVRERLNRTTELSGSGALDGLGDIIGSIDHLPADLSSRTKYYLRAGYGRKRSR